MRAPGSWSLTWVVKTSKLCNLRCAYCYEWDELGNSARMARSTWLKLLDAAGEYHEIFTTRGVVPRTSVVLHGGEPLVLPQSELRRLAETFSERFSSPGFRLGLQTNLYRLTGEHLALFREHGISVGVSFDGVPGIRVALGGRPTEDGVRRNMDRLARAGVRFGLITVLAAHTVVHLPRIYDWVVRQQLPWRVLPLFDGPDSRDTRLFTVDSGCLVKALCALFDRWFADGARHPVDPLSEYLQTAVKHLTGIRPRLYDRATDGDGVFVVNLDGRLYRVLDGYDTALAMGNVAEQSLADILASPAYAASLARDAAETAAHCRDCAFAGPCTGWPVFEARQQNEHGARCRLAYPVIEHICRRLVEEGYDTPRLLGMTERILAEQYV